MPERSMTSLPTVAPRSVAGTSLRAPPKVPIAVLRGVEMTISLPLPLFPKLTFPPSSLPFAKGYTKRQGPGFTTRALPMIPRKCFPLAVGPPLRLVQVTPVVGEHGVQEVHVGVDRLLGEGLGGLLLLALLLDQVLRQLPVALGLRPEVVDHAVEEILRQLRVELLGRDGAVRQRLVRLLGRVSELLRRLVYLLLLLLVHIKL